MKYLLLSLVLVNVITFHAIEKCNPGCVRQNSDEIRRDLLFVHIEDAHWNLLYSLLDSESIFFTDRSGKSIIEKLHEVAQKRQTDISEPLKRIEKLRKQAKRS